MENVDTIIQYLSIKDEIMENERDDDGSGEGS